jgi:hypothetical protein
MSHCTFSPSSNPTGQQAAANQHHKPSAVSKALFTRPHSINSFDVEAGLGLDIIAVTEGQEVVYFRR